MCGGVLDLEPLTIRQRNEARGPKDAYINSWGTSQFQLLDGDWTFGPPPLKEATTIEEIEAFDWPDKDRSHPRGALQSPGQKNWLKRINTR